jgi:GNAT superfamily N-acetyltransferase
MNTVDAPTIPVDLGEAIDALLVLGPAPSERLRYLDIAGVTAAMGATPAHYDNRVGLTDAAPEVADALIARVLAAYRDAGHGVQWFVSPRSRPVDLARRLEAHGFEAHAEGDLIGMALATTDAAFHAPPGADVRTVGIGEIRRNVHVMAEGFGMPTAAALDVLDMLAAGGVEGSEMLHYLALDAGEPVGYAEAYVDHRRRVTLLGGSAVLAPYRGRGHYRALVRARIGDARRLGSAAVVVQARRATSAPILARLGFEEVMPVQGYVMAAPTHDAPAPGG